MDYKFRFYSPLLGRFISPDNITPGGPQGLNRYSYVYNRPINLNDPTGHCPEEDSACRDRLKKTLPKPDGGSETPTVPNGIPTAPPVIPIPTETPSSPNIIIPSYESDTAPLNIVCITPTPGTINCFLPRYPGVGLGIGFKDWEDIDKVDLAVDGGGILGDIVLKVGGLKAMPFWFLTEMAELGTVGRAWDQLESGGDPTGIPIDTLITVGQSAKLIPLYGWLGNAVGLASNVLEIKAIH